MRPRVSPFIPFHWGQSVDDKPKGGWVRGRPKTWKQKKESCKDSYNLHAWSLFRIFESEGTHLALKYFGSVTGEGLKLLDTLSLTTYDNSSLFWSLTWGRPFAHKSLLWFVQRYVESVRKTNFSFLRNFCVLPLLTFVKKLVKVLRL